MKTEHMKIRLHAKKCVRKIGFGENFIQLRQSLLGLIFDYQIIQPHVKIIWRMCIQNNNIMNLTSWKKGHSMRSYSFKVCTLFPVFTVGQVMNQIPNRLPSLIFLLLCLFIKRYISLRKLV